MSNQRDEQGQLNNFDWDSLPAFFGPRELGKFLGVGQAAAYAMTRQHGFPVLKIGRQYRISKDGLRRWIEKETGMAS